MKTLTEEHKLNISKSLKGRFTGKDRYWNIVILKNGYDKITNDLAYIIGVLYGDGYIIKNGGIGLQTIDDDFAHAFGDAVFRQFGIESNYYKTKQSELKDWRNGKTYNRKGTTILQAKSVLIRDFIQKIKNFGFVDKLNKEQKISFLRGLWDSEGSVSISGYTTVVQFTHNTFELCELFRKILLEITGIESKIRVHPQKNHVLYFYRKEHIKNFYEIIQPTIQRKRDKFEFIINRFK